jgi:small conductance mechanosensitive channel
MFLLSATISDELKSGKFDFQEMINTLVVNLTDLGLTLLKALAIYIIGKFIIKILNKVIRNILEKRHVEPSIKSFVCSLVNVLLTILLIISVIGALGVQTTTFAALLASAGVAVGMALSGNLANFAGGLIILLFRPFKVGDFIEYGATSGTVKEIQIFHTVMNTGDNKVVYVPNGSLSSGSVTNYSREDKRRIDWTYGVEYGSDFETVKAAILEVIKSDSRILSDPEPMIVLTDLADSSVNILVRVWVGTGDYWSVYFDMNQKIYEKFNAKGIGFPFPQLTVHQE